MGSARTAVDIGKQIKFLRQKKEWSQGELAARSALTQVSISHIENGKGGTLKALEKILRALEVELSFQEIPAIDTRKSKFFIK